MATKKAEVRFYHVHEVCPACKQGNMIFDSDEYREEQRYLTFHAVPYPHKCNQCKHGGRYDEVYPLAMMWYGAIENGN